MSEFELSIIFPAFIACLLVLSTHVPLGVEVLRRGGLLAIELDSGRASDVLALSRAAGWIDARTERDLFGRPRFLLATKELS